MSWIETKQNVALTNWAGCDMYLLSEGKQIGTIDGLIWEQQNIIRGKIIFESFEPTDEVVDIGIFLREQGELGVYHMQNVHLRLNLFKGQLVGVPHDFEAKAIVKVDSHEGL